jgi:hypothetical protein
MTASRLVGARRDADGSAAASTGAVIYLTSRLMLSSDRLGLDADWRRAVATH